VIKLKEPGERGGRLTIELSPFDILSLQEGLNYANNHLLELQEAHADDEGGWALADYTAAKLKDVRANFKELEQVLEDREKVLPR
jgi:hypothetical protein